MRICTWLGFDGPVKWLGECTQEVIQHHRNTSWDGNSAPGLWRSWTPPQFHPVLVILDQGCPATQTPVFSALTPPGFTTSTMINPSEVGSQQLSALTLEFWTILRFPATEFMHTSDTRQRTSPSTWAESKAHTSGHILSPESLTFFTKDKAGSKGSMQRAVWIVTAPLG
jgi:hypothetical protein